MQKIDDFELDLLLRIDFFSLTAYSENDDYTDQQFEADKKAIQEKYGFERYYRKQEGGYEYIRLSDLKQGVTPYVEYLQDLKRCSIFWCCPLEQVVGLFQNGELKGIFSTDTGLCYNLQGHINGIEAIYTLGSLEEGMSVGAYEFSNFCGLTQGDRLQVGFDPHAAHIDPNSTWNETFELNLEDFKRAMDKLKSEVLAFYPSIKAKMSEWPDREDDERLADVFNESLRTGAGEQTQDLLSR